MWSQRRRKCILIKSPGAKYSFKMEVHRSLHTQEEPELELLRHCSLSNVRGFRKNKFSFFFQTWWKSRIFAFDKFEHCENVTRKFSPPTLTFPQMGGRKLSRSCQTFIWFFWSCSFSSCRCYGYSLLSRVWRGLKPAWRRREPAVLHSWVNSTDLLFGTKLGFWMSFPDCYIRFCWAGSGKRDLIRSYTLYLQTDFTQNFLKL